jgi:hypothetical protein
MSAGRLTDDDPGLRALLGEDAGDALQRAAGAVAGDEVVEPLAGEILDDLARRGARMEVGIGLVLELAGEEPAMGIGELDRLLHHAEAALGRRRDDDLGAEEAHEPAALDAERFGHGDDERIAFGGADHGEPDAGIAAGRLDDGLAGLQLARLLRRLDDAERQAVLDRAERIEGLDLDVEVDAGRGEAVDAHHRRAPDGLEDALEFRHLADLPDRPPATMRHLGAGRRGGNDAGHI